MKAILTNKYASLVCRLSLGIVFVVSAVSKLPKHSVFVEIVKDYDLLPDFLAVIYGNVLPWVELIVGVYLLAGILVRQSAVVAVLMGLSFMVANISSIVSGDSQCGSCFGETFTLPLWMAATLDVYILIAAAVLVVFARGKLLFSLESRLVDRDKQ